MRDPGTRSINVPAGTGTGVLLVTGFSGSPIAITKAILDSKHVQAVAVQRSGSQIELTVELLQTATVSRLRKIVEQLQEFDATMQGSQSIPVPTLVLSLVSVETRRRRFLRRRSRQASSASDSTTPPGPTPQTATAAADSAPVQTPPAVIARPSPAIPPPEPEPEATPRKAPDPIVLIAKSAIRAVLRSISTELRGAITVIGRSIRIAASFVVRQLAQLAVSPVRPISRMITALPGVISRISLVITTAGNSVFGTDASDDPDAEQSAPKETRNEKDTIR